MKAQDMIKKKRGIFLKGQLKFVGIENVVIEVKYLISELNRKLDIASERGDEFKGKSEEIIQSADKWVEAGLEEVKNSFRGCSGYLGRRWLWCPGQKKVVLVKIEKRGWIRMNFRILCISWLRKRKGYLKREVCLSSERKTKTNGWKLERSWLSHIIKKILLF